MSSICWKWNGNIHSKPSFSFGSKCSMCISVIEILGCLLTGLLVRRWQENQWKRTEAAQVHQILIQASIIFGRSSRFASWISNWFCSYAIVTLFLRQKKFKLKTSFHSFSVFSQTSEYTAVNKCHFKPSLSWKLLELHLLSGFC